MDSTAQCMFAFGFIVFAGFAGIALLIYVNNKFDNNDQ